MVSFHKETLMRLRACFLFLGFWSSSALASLDGSGSILIEPLIAQTPSYVSEITVHNPFSDPLPVSVSYTGGSVTTAAGFRTCAPLVVPGSSTIQFSVGTQCALPGGGHFGYITLSETSSFPIPFQAYSRTQTPGGNGFSVPAFPAGAIEAPYWGHYVVGLKRQSAAPVYQTNCFVASTDASTPYAIRLLNAGGVQIGSTISGFLSAHQMVRYLDIFSAAGLPPGDLSNVRAEFSAGAAPTAALLSFCTVQESTFFGADFRMAQPVETRDGTRQRLQVAEDAFDYVADFFHMTRHDIAIRHPDRVRCGLTSASASVLEIRLVDPNGAVVAGGNNLTDTGTIYTGPRNLYGGFSDFWHLEVSPRETYLGPYPVFYTFACFTGNGSGMPIIPSSVLDIF
jgi:hypothetical protein